MSVLATLCNDSEVCNCKAPCLLRHDLHLQWFQLPGSSSWVITKDDYYDTVYSSLGQSYITDPIWENEFLQLQNQHYKLCYLYNNSITANSSPSKISIGFKWNSWICHEQDVNQHTTPKTKHTEGKFDKEWEVAPNSVRLTVNPLRLICLSEVCWGFMFMMVCTNVGT